MRSLGLIAALPLLALTACGGASGPQSVGSSAPPAGTGGTGGSGGSGGGIGTGTGSPTPTPTQAHFLDVSTATTFQAEGSFQSLGVTETGVPLVQGPKLYQGNASTARAPSGSIAYDPRDGIFTISFADGKAGVNMTDYRFQDPAHRTEYGQWGVPSLTDFNYLEGVGPEGGADRVDTVTFFYQRPGSKTTWVSLAGYVRNAFTPGTVPGAFEKDTQSKFERGAMVFGTQTARAQVPITGTATYNGGMLATMVVNTDTASNPGFPTYFQWLTGSAKIDIDFGKATMGLLLTGTATAANYAGDPVPDNFTGVPQGSIFTATGTGKIDLVKSGGFTGSFSSASFATTNGGVVPVYDPVNPNNSTSGANSIDGTFFGPNAVNVGGNFRIVDGKPDQRVDILGAFTGAKQ